MNLSVSSWSIRIWYSYRPVVVVVDVPSPWFVFLVIFDVLSFVVRLLFYPVMMWLLRNDVELHRYVQ